MKTAPIKAGAGLQRLRESRELTRTQLAYHLGITERALQSYELADRRLSLALFVEIARYFDLTLDKAFAAIFNRGTGETDRATHTV